MEQLLLVNPTRRRRRKAHHARKRRTHHRRRAPMLFENPARRKRRTHHRRRHSIRAYRNPSRRGGSMRSVEHIAVDGAVGAVGGALIDFAMKLAPATWKTGTMSYLARAGGAIALGLVGNMARIPKSGELAVGAMTIALYGALRDLVTTPMGLNEYTINQLPTLTVNSGQPANLPPAGGVAGYTPDYSYGPAQY